MVAAEEVPTGLEGLESPTGLESPAADDVEEMGTVEAAQRKMAQDEEDESEVEDEVAEDHLKESVDGALSLKRMLSRNDNADENGAPKKRQKRDHIRPAARAKIMQILVKWGLHADSATKYVLERLSLKELKELNDSGYKPDVHSQYKTPAELCGNHLSQLRERQIVGGGPLDSISVFKARWQLSEVDAQLLRKLCHKDLRYVLAEYDGEQSIEDIIQEAELSLPEEGVAAGAAPDGPGIATMGRFLRLELIDPLSDALVVGDANLHFSLNLVRHRKALGHVGRCVCTTFEPLETLKERYKEIEETIAELEENFAEVWHEVDGTRIALDSRFAGHEESFGAVYYNFPHSGAVRGFFDGHPFVRWRHENLMHLFFRALVKYVKPGGCVKVASNMGAVGVRYSDIIGGAARSEFVHIETVPFKEWCLHRYGRSYGDRRDAHKRPDSGENYNAQGKDKDMVYSFCYAPTDEPLPAPHFTCPPSKRDIMDSKEGPLANLMGPSKKAACEELYKRFLSEVKGVHVG